MEPKVFDDLDEMETWVKDNPGKVSRHLLNAWREVIKNDKDTLVVVKAQPKGYHEDMNIVVEHDEAEEALDTLLEEAIDREDYEIAEDIKTLQKEIA